MSERAVASWQPFSVPASPVISSPSISTSKKKKKSRESSADPEQEWERALERAKSEAALGHVPDSSDSPSDETTTSSDPSTPFGVKKKKVSSLKLSLTLQDTGYAKKRAPHLGDANMAGSSEDDASFVAQHSPTGRSPPLQHRPPLHRTSVSEDSTTTTTADTPSASMNDVAARSAHYLAELEAERHKSAQLQSQVNKLEEKVALLARALQQRGALVAELEATSEKQQKLIDRLLKQAAKT